MNTKTLSNNSFRQRGSKFKTRPYKQMANAMEKRLRRHTSADPHLDRVAHRRGKRKIMEILSWWDREFWAGLGFKFRRLATWLPGVNDVEIGEEEGAGQVEEVMDVDEDVSDV